jgi:septal ring factor EnvC (AmiA/AmiB activator)
MYAHNLLAILLHLFASACCTTCCHPLQAKLAEIRQLAAADAAAAAAKASGAASKGKAGAKGGAATGRRTSQDIQVSRSQHVWIHMKDGALPPVLGL